MELFSKIRFFVLYKKYQYEWDKNRFIRRNRHQDFSRGFLIPMSDDSSATRVVDGVTERDWDTLVDVL